MTFPRFVIAGGLNTALTYILYLGLLPLMPYAWAYSLSYVAGIALGYLLNSKWVFKSQASFRTATAYPLTYGINYVLGVGLLWLLVEFVGVPKEIAPLIVVAVSMPVMYVITRSLFQGRLDHETKAINQ